MRLQLLSLEVRSRLFIASIQAVKKLSELEVDPACVVLDPKEATLMAVSCDVFDYDREDISNNRITVEWKDLPIQYNP
ncbi:hypothetical protein Q1695_006258 [Nippostrongylus brasiliensis]|nr:hypothetical protein Q1695_006258 [Nippostrongylus brasiliensis]